MRNGKLKCFAVSKIGLGCTGMSCSYVPAADIILSYDGVFTVNTEINKTEIAGQDIQKNLRQGGKNRG